MICFDLNVMLILLSLELINKTNNKKMFADAAVLESIGSSLYVY